MLRRNHVDQAVAHRKEIDLHPAFLLSPMQPIRPFDHRLVNAVEQAAASAGIVHHIEEYLLPAQPLSIIQDSLPVDEAFDLPLGFRNPVNLSHKILKHHVRIEIGRFEPVRFLVAQVLMLAVGPVVLGVNNRHAIHRNHEVAPVNPRKQVQGLVRPVDSADRSARKTLPDFLAHRHNRLAPIFRVNVPFLSEVHPAAAAKPVRRKTDFRPQKGLLTRRRTTPGRSRRGNVTYLLC